MIEYYIIVGGSPGRIRSPLNSIYDKDLGRARHKLGAPKRLFLSRDTLLLPANRCHLLYTKQRNSISHKELRSDKAKTQVTPKWLYYSHLFF